MQDEKAFLIGGTNVKKDWHVSFPVQNHILAAHFISYLVASIRKSSGKCQACVFFFPQESMLHWGKMDLKMVVYSKSASVFSGSTRSFNKGRYGHLFLIFLAVYNTAQPIGNLSRGKCA